MHVCTERMEAKAKRQRVLEGFLGFQSGYDFSEWRIIEHFPKQQLYKWLPHQEEEIYALILELVIHAKASWGQTETSEGNTC